MTDREKAIATLTEHLDHWRRLLSEGICTKDEGERTIYALTFAIENIQSIEPFGKPNKWIPVSERLPEVGSQVLVCFDFKGKRSVYISDFYGDREFHGLDDEYLTPEGRKCRKAVAWMPLPEPYKAESEYKKEGLKYCDRNICVSNEYSGIGCDECLGNVRSEDNE